MTDVTVRVAGGGAAIRRIVAQILCDMLVGVVAHMQCSQIGLMPTVRCRSQPEGLEAQKHREQESETATHGARF